MKLNRLNISILLTLKYTFSDILMQFCMPLHILQWRMDKGIIEFIQVVLLQSFFIILGKNYILTYWNWLVSVHLSIFLVELVKQLILFLIKHEIKPKLRNICSLPTIGFHTPTIRRFIRKGIETSLSFNQL